MCQMYSIAHPHADSMEYIYIKSPRIQTKESINSLGKINASH